MKIIIAKEIEVDATLVIAVERINSILAEIVRKASDEVTAHWELAGDPKSRILFLQLWYEDQGAGITVDPLELENPPQLKSKLRGLWGDLIEVRLSRLVAQMKAMIREEVGS